ncbi:MAG: cupin domain-containing protein [Rubrobacteraceae bacterium]
MAKRGDTIENPVTRERLTWLDTSNDTNGELLRFELFVKPGGSAPVSHIHMKQSKSFEVVTGKMRYRAGEEKVKDLHAGESMTIAPGAPHIRWNPGDEEMRVIVEFRPALNTETFIENMWGFARDGRKRGGKGIPNMLQLAVWFAGTYEGENYLERFPISVQKALFDLLAPIGKRLGYKDWYPEYTDPSELPGRRSARREEIAR